MWQENDGPNGNTPQEVEQLLAPPSEELSDEDMGRQEGRSENGEGEEKGEGGDAFSAADVAAGSMKSSGGASCSFGRKRGKDGGGGGAGNAAAIETIQKLLLMIPVDLEKLRNLAWEKGGYQVREEKRDIELLFFFAVLVVLVVLCDCLPFFHLYLYS